MSEKVVCEVLREDGWLGIGSVTEADPPASFSSESPSGDRQVYMFGWYHDERGVWRSRMGIDIATPRNRLVLATPGGLERLSNLADGPWEIDRWFANGTQGRVRVRSEWS